MTALYPRTDDLPGVEDADLDRYLKKLKRDSNGAIWGGVLAGTAVFTLSPIFTIRRARPSFLLSDKELDTHAYKLANSRSYVVRQSVFLLKLFAGLCWGEHKDVREHFHMNPYPDDPRTFRNDRMEQVRS